MRKPQLLSILGALFLACCATETSPDRPATAFLEVNLETATGEPVPLVLASLVAWPDPDSGITREAAMETEGHHVFPLGRFDTGVIDSFYLAAAASECSGFDSVIVAVRPGIRLRSPADTLSAGTLRLSRVHPRGRLALGPVCADGVENGDPFTYFSLMLWFDEIAGDSVQGRWRKTYQASYGDEWGYFFGLRTGSTLDLSLELLTPWGSCTDYQLTVLVTVSDTLDQGALSATDCLFGSDRLRFTEGEFLEPLLPAKIGTKGGLRPL